jgi:hypothetical protein
MDYENVPAAAFGHALSGISVNLLVRDVRAEAAFLAAVFDMQAHRLSADFAIMLHAGQPFQLHSDATFAAHPLFALLPESGPRGAGIELRLHEADPDLAAARLADFPDAMLLQPPTDKPGHGLREAVILCPNGYAWVPSRRINPSP